MRRRRAGNPDDRIFRSKTDYEWCPEEVKQWEDQGWEDEPSQWESPCDPDDGKSLNIHFIL